MILNGAATLSIMTLIWTTFSITTSQHNSTLYTMLLCWLSFLLNVIYVDCRTKPFMLSVNILNVIMLSVIMLSVIMLSVIMRNVIYA